MWMTTSRTSLSLGIDPASRKAFSRWIEEIAAIDRFIDRRRQRDANADIADLEQERGQSEAIGRNLFVMAGLKVPLIATVIGEGGSGGALAIAVADEVLMLQYATYSVISPEGCASILWKSASKAPDAAESLGITADRLHKLGLVDRVVPEPLGGAHRNPGDMSARLKKELLRALKGVDGLAPGELVARRQQRLRAYGRFKEAA